MQLSNLKPRLGLIFAEFRNVDSSGFENTIQRQGCPALKIDDMGVVLKTIPGRHGQPTDGIIAISLAYQYRDRALWSFACGRAIAATRDEFQVAKTEPT